MQVRGIRLGAVLVPLVVAIVPITILVWYGFVRIPSKEIYLNERNLRLLTTLSGAIKAKIDSYDGALDNAVQSFALETPEDRRRFEDGVNLFAPDLEITTLLLDENKAPRSKTSPVDHSIEQQMLDNAADPPRAATERDEGRYWLYLGAKLENRRQTATRIVARVNLDAVLTPLLDDRKEFAAVLVTTSTGEVIAQKSPVGLMLARLDGVIDFQHNAPARTEDGKDKDKDRITFGRVSTFSNMVPVDIGGVSYRLYMQPISLSLLTAKPDPDTPRQSEQWVLCGLARADRFKADTSALSYTTLLWFSAVLAVLALAIPFVKLRALHTRERWRAADSRWLTAATVIAVALLTLGTADVVALHVRLRQNVDTRLKAVADTLSRHVANEVQQVAEQGELFDTQVGRRFKKVSDRLRALKMEFPAIHVVGDDPPTVKCWPEEACQPDVLRTASGIDTRRYPFFDLVTWAGNDGWQRMRWMPGRKTRPFLNIFDSMLPYADLVRSAWNEPTGPEVKGLDVLSSPNTGEPLTALWRTYSGSIPTENRVQTLITSTLISLDRPVIPKGMSFAVFKEDGSVLFHSSPNRRLQENFLKECEDNAELRALLKNGGEPVSVSYRGLDYRVYVEPLTFAAFHGREDPKWRLAVLQESAIVDTLNLETLTIASWLFAVYAGLLVIVAALIHIFAPWQPKWFWPDERKGRAYRQAVVLNAGAIAAFILLFSIGAAVQWPDAVLIGTAALALAAAFGTYRIITRARPESPRREAFGWRHPFFLARTAFLVVTAALPTLACFHVAYTFETRLLASAEIATRQDDLVSLKARTSAKANQLSGSGTAPHIIAAQLEQFRSGNTYVPLWEGADQPGNVAGSTWLNWVLGGMHRDYNDAAIEFKAQAGGTTAPVSLAPLNVGWLLAIVVGLCAACFAFVYWFVRPMFALDAMARPFVPTVVNGRSEHVLVVGPPGSGKSTTLALIPGIRVIDIAARSSIAPASSALVGAGSSAGAAPPPVEAPDIPQLPPLLAVDHADYRIEEPEFAGQTLALIERAMYQNGSTVRIVCDRDPVACLRDSNAATASVDRWIRSLRSCRREMVRIDGSTRGQKQLDLIQQTTDTAFGASAGQAVLDESRGIPALEALAYDVLRCIGPASTLDDALTSFASAAAPYYASLWNACSVDQRLALRQIAEEGVVNPQNQTVVRDLLESGHLVRDRGVRIMNTTFRDFVIHATGGDQVSAWERRGVMIPWGSIEVAMLTVVVLLAGLLVVTQQQLINAWVGFIPAVVPAAKQVWKTFAALRPSAAKEALIT